MLCRYAFNGPFNVNFLLGPVDDGNSADFTLLSNQIGSTGIFAGSATDECENCEVQKTAGTLYGDVVTLTSELTKYLQSNTVDVGVPNHLRILESLDPEKVVPYLTENLNWRITTVSEFEYLSIDMSGTSRPPHSVCYVSWKASVLIL